MGVLPCKSGEKGRKRGEAENYKLNLLEETIGVVMSEGGEDRGRGRSKRLNARRKAEPRVHNAAT